MRIWLFLLSVFAVLSVLIWADDAITLQGERTVYTVTCRQGAWQTQHCTGRLGAADRYRFKALKARREVLFWTLGVAEPSGRFTDCAIQDGRNWSCSPTADASRTITRAMVHGQPIAGAGGPTLPLHAVPKWKWWLLRWGVYVGSDADM